MEFDWKTSRLFLKYQAVCWTSDPLQMNPIIDEGLSSSNPVERAHWLNMKANQIAGHPEIPDHLNRAWDTLEAALEAALETAPDPGLHQFRTSLVQMALAILSFEGPVHRIGTLFARMQPGVARYVREPAIRFNIAVLYMTAGRFRKSELWLNRAFRAKYLDTKSALGKANALAVRAWVLALQDRADEGEADMEEARRLFDSHGEGRHRLFSLAMAETWVTLKLGRLQAARTSLQEFMAQSPWRGNPLYVFQSHVLAACLALAEGSEPGYGFYCEQALAVCQQHDMTLSRDYLKAVMAGAEQDLAEWNQRQGEQA